MGPTTAGPFCNPVQPQTWEVCVTGSGSNSLEHPMGQSGYLRLPTSFTTQHGRIQSDGSGLSGIILIAPGWSNMPWFWDLVLGLGLRGP